MKNTITTIVLLLLTFFAGWWLGRDSSRVTTQTVTHVDTIFYERPQLVGISDKLTVNVPRMLFAPATLFREATKKVEIPSQPVTICHGLESSGYLPEHKDSVQITITTKQYQDSTYRAQVSGVQIGDYSPTLDWIEVYNRNTTTSVVVRDPYKWEIGAAAGAWVTPDGNGAWLGASARYNLGRLSIAGLAGYDPKRNGLIVQAVAGLTLWRK